MSFSGDEKPENALKQLPDCSQAPPVEAKKPLDVNATSCTNPQVLAQLGEKLPPKAQELFLQIIQLQQKGMIRVLPGSSHSAEKTKQTTNLAQSNTNIRIRIPKRPRKQPAPAASEDELSSPRENNEIISSKKKHTNFNKNSFLDEFEYDNDYDDDKISFRIPKRSTSTHFSPFLTRSSTPVPKFLPPKRVLTPDWDSSPILEPLKNDENEKIFNGEEEEENENDKIWRIELDREERHRRLEIYESRIIWGSSLFEHPAQSITAAHNGIPYVLSKEEHEKANRYEEVKCQHIVPKFWEPRVWDKPEDVISAEKTEELLKEIIDASTPKLQKENVHKSSKSTPRKTLKRSQSVSISMANKKKSYSRKPILLPIGHFETDDEFSDWEDLL